MTRRQAGQSYLDLARRRDAHSAAIEAWAASVVGTLAPSVQVAIYTNGELAVSLAAGLDTRRGAHVTRASLFNLYSSTKLFQCLCMLHLHDRGYFDFDDPVAAHWPEFADHGKESVTIGHVLSHRAGMAVEPAGTTWTWWGDRQEVARRMAAMPLKWVPGTQQGYHNRTCGFICDTLAWKWTGRGIGELLTEWVFEPLGVADFHFGVDRPTYDSRVVLTESPVLDRPMPARSRDEFRPFIGGELNLFNSFELLGLPLTWGTAVASAESAAEVACFFAGKGLHRAVRLFSEDVFAQATTPRSGEGEHDQTLGRPVAWGLGPQLRLFEGVPGLAGTLGHGGGTTVQVWACPEAGVAAACILGGLRAGPAGGALGGIRWQEGFARAVSEDLASA